MPLIEVSLFEHRLNDRDQMRRVIESLTDALAAALGEEVRDETWVVVRGVSPSCWGMGGQPRG